jgi:hypothetical protein
MRVRDNTIIAVEGIGAIEQTQAVVAQINWGLYGPAADVLDRALAMARTAALQMQNAATLEEFRAGRKLANLANEELVKAVKLAESIEKKQPGVSGIGEVDQAIGDIAQAQAEVDQIDWEGMTPAADVLKRGMAMARTAAIQMRDARTPAEYAIACQLANKANAEMVKAAMLADQIEQKAAVSGIGFSLSSLANGIKKAASTVAKSVVTVAKATAKTATTAAKAVSKTPVSVIKTAASTAAKAVVAAAKVPAKVVQTVTNAITSKIAEMTGVASKLRAARQAGQAQMQELSALLPSVKNAQLRADILKLQQEASQLDTATAAKLNEANKQVDDAKKQSTAVQGLGNSEIGEIGIGPLAVVAVGVGIAALVVAMTKMIANWSNVRSKSKVLSEQAKADGKLSDTEKAAIEENAHRRELATTQSEDLQEEAQRLQEQSSQLVEQANQLAAEGKTEEANQVLQQAQARQTEAATKGAQANAILEPFVQPMAPVTVPSTARAEAAATAANGQKSPGGEKSWFEKNLGINPTLLVLAITAMVIVPRLIPQRRSDA